MICVRHLEAPALLIQLAAHNPLHTEPPQDQTIGCCRACFQAIYQPIISDLSFVTYRVHAVVDQKILQFSYVGDVKLIHEQIIWKNLDFHTQPKKSVNVHRLHDSCVGLRRKQGGMLIGDF